MAAASHALGYESFLVGGMVRDFMLGLTLKAPDILVMKGDPDRLALALYKEHGFRKPVLFRRFGTCMTWRKGIQVEIVGRRGDTPGEDALHRDFTANCLFVKLSERSGPILDPTGRGLADIKKKNLITPADPAMTIREDPLRMLRGARLAAQLGFRLDPAFVKASRAHAAQIRKVSGERIRDEILHTIMTERPSTGFRLLLASGLLEEILPELAQADGFNQDSPYHSCDLFSHTMEVIDRSEPDYALRLAALLHDVGKLRTRQKKDGHSVFYGHQDVSASVARSFLKKYSFPRRLSDRVIFLVLNHMVNYSPEWKDSTVRRFAHKMDQELEWIIKLARTDSSTLRDPSDPVKQIDELETRVKRILKEEGTAHVESPLDGNQIQKILGIQPGKLIGRLKDELREAVIEGKIPNTRRAARNYLMRISKDKI
jgi:poly(A) polymerase